MIIDDRHYCDCCGEPLYHYISTIGKGRNFGYIACTTEGVKTLCYKCKTKYNVLDRLPNKDDILMHTDGTLGIDITDD